MAPPRTRKRFQFAKGDQDLPTQLKVRIGGWKDVTPSSQFQQYGPINKYLQLKFNRDTHMVKPQALFREPLEEDDDQILLQYGRQPGGLNTLEEVKEHLDDLLDDLEAGNISFDSTHPGYVRKTSAAGTKVYPDFAVCEHFDDVNDPKPSEFVPNREDRDVVRVIVEIASVPRGISKSKLETVKDDIIKQLSEYMERLGPDGTRWRGKALGIALVGTEVAFLTMGHNEKKWVLDRGESGKLPKWDSLFSSRFERWIETAVAYSD